MNQKAYVSTGAGSHAQIKQRRLIEDGLEHFPFTKLVVSTPENSRCTFIIVVVDEMPDVYAVLHETCVADRLSLGAQVVSLISHQCTRLDSHHGPDRVFTCFFSTHHRPANDGDVVYVLIHHAPQLCYAFVSHIWRAHHAFVRLYVFPRLRRLPALRILPHTFRAEAEKRGSGPSAQARGWVRAAISGSISSAPRSEELVNSG